MRNNFILIYDFNTRFCFPIANVQPCKLSTPSLNMMKAMLYLLSCPPKWIIILCCWRFLLYQRQIKFKVTVGNEDFSDRGVSGIGFNVASSKNIGQRNIK